MSDSFEVIVDMSNPRDRQQVIAAVHGLQGVQRVSACQYRPRTTDRQRKWYFPCFCVPFAKLLLAEGNKFPIDPKEAAHRILKGMWLKEYDADGHEYLLSITEISTLRFNHYLDDCANYLAELGIFVPEPNVYHEPLTEKDHAIV